MFTTVLGIPAHPLLVHVPVVLVPMLVLVTIGYAVLPRWRDRVGWAVVVLAVAAPLGAWAAVLSGNAFRHRLISRGVAPAILTRIDGHMRLGNLTLWATVTLALIGLATVYLSRRPKRPAPWLSALMVVLIVLAGAVAGYYVVRTGDAGAHIVWTGL